MSANKAVRLAERHDDPMIISRTEEGFRVYAASDPTRSYIVAGGFDAPTCTCSDFQHHEGDLNWYCGHIVAVFDQLRRSADRKALPLSEEEEERLAIQEEGNIRSLATDASENSVVPSQMLIKRSVSPDGRIDSLSVEFSCGVANLAVRDIKLRAAATLGIQRDIVKDFLAGNSSNGHQPVNQNGHGPASATLLSIGGTDGRWGRRLFIRIRSNGQVLRLFGTRKQLKQHLDNAGFTDVQEVQEGMVLNLPCKVVTSQSDDQQWLNVDEILPASLHSSARRAGS